MAVAATQVTAVVAVVLIAVRRVSLMVIALRVHRTVTRPAQKPRRALTSRQALTPVALSSQHVHPMVVTTAAITMIAHHAQAVTPVTVAVLKVEALAAVKIVVQRLLIVVVRTHASALRVLNSRHVRMKAVKNVVHSAVTALTLAPLLVMATAMIAPRVLSVIVIRVHSLIAHHAPILIVNRARLAHQRHAANTHHVHALSVRSHSSGQSAPNTRPVQRVRSSMKLARRVIANALQVLQQRLPLTVAIAQHVVQPSKLNTRRQSQHRAANSCSDVARLCAGLTQKAGIARLFAFCNVRKFADVVRLITRRAMPAPIA